MSPLRVLVVSEPMEYGVLTYLEALCDGLDSARCELALAFSPRRMAPQAHGLVARLRARDVRVRSLPFHRGAGLGDARAAAGLLGELRTFRPDVVHCHSTKAGMFGRVLAAALRIPALYTPHGTSWHYTGVRLGRVQLALERALRRLTTTLVSVCPEEARAFVSEVGYHPDRVRVVPNGVRLPAEVALARTRARTRRALGMRPDEVWLVFVGRLTPEKGADVLLRTLEADVGANGLLVIGEGSGRHALQARARRARIPVRFCGYQPDVSPFLAAADVFVQPSRSEGLPFATLEAMAHSLPVVCSRVGGVASAVEGCGLVIPPDDPPALEIALRTLSGDLETRLALGEAGRRRVAREFSEASMVAGLRAAYEAACRRPAASSLGTFGAASWSEGGRGAAR